MSAPASSARRDSLIIGLIGASHMTSHFFQLALPPLFPLLKLHFDVSYTALGALMSLFYAVSGLCQAPSGILVDRFGGRRVLIVGTAMLACAIGLAGLVPEFWMLFPLAVIGGAGNGVYHPADYAILSHSVSKARLGRAYSIHGLGGTLGYAVSPVIVGAMVQIWSWPTALAVASLVGLGFVAALTAAGGLIADPLSEQPHGVPRDSHAKEFLALIARPGIIAGFLYFALASSVTIGLQNAGVPAMISLYGVQLDLAAWMLTAFLLANASGALAGGIMADRTIHHDRMAIAGVLLGAGCMLAIAAPPPSFAIVIALAAVAGFALGTTAPARDMLIRAASPPGATGRVFGVVYSGLDLGSALIPVAAGWLLDRGEPRAVFLVFAVALLLTIATVLRVKRSAVVQLPAV